MSINFSLPVRVTAVEGRLFHLDSNYVIYSHDQYLNVFVSSDLETTMLVAPTPIECEVSESFLRMDDYIYFDDDADLSEKGCIYRLNIGEHTVVRVSEGMFTSCFPVKIDDEYGYFATDHKKLSKLKLDSLTIVTETQKYRRSGPPVSLASGFCIKSKNDLNFFNSELDLVKKVDIEEVLSEANLKITSRLQSHKNNVLIGLSDGSVASIGLGTSLLNWRVGEFFDNRWCVGNEGQVYSVFKGNLKVVDAETGDLLLDKPINSDWVQAEKDTLNLFQVNVSATHLWCGFLGHGLCAVNLETAEIDWHEFDGQSLNRKPIIKNNRIYVQLMSGGIGLDNEGTQEYILEGEGGYIEDSDNEFVVF